MSNIKEASSVSFKQNIETLIKSNLKTYQDNSDRFIADYNRELELTKEYNGRQLLELLQNADDAGAEEVEIVWDKESALLTVSNKGEAFSIGGIKSLMLANLSTKTRITYIGNKGLGFRSILNWAEFINIYTNDCKISFSEAIVKDVFDTKLNLSESDRDLLRDERNLSKTATPFPTLAIPNVEDNIPNADWTTTIEITCKREFEEDIEKQLSELREEILLFLNNIQRIYIRNNGDDKLLLESIKNEQDGYESVSIKEKHWKVFTKEKILPVEYQDKNKNEQQSYILKVAFQDDLSDSYKKLFNFFPTQLSISLPCIIHGTFELNSSRNHLNESKKNEYILKELVHLLMDCSTFFTQQGIDWRPYKILRPTTIISDSKLIEVFYKDLENLRQTETIYPTISNQYQPLSDVVYHNDEFNLFFMNNFPESLPGLLIPLGTEVENKFTKYIFEHDYLIEKIDELSQTEIAISLRAELIAQLSKVIPFKDDHDRFSLLVNESGKVISKEDLAFTPVVRSEEKFNIPKSVKVDFMKSELYDLLISTFENTFDKKEPKSRELQRTIKSIVNIQPYDSNNVIDKIITGSKDALKSLTTFEEKVICIKEMVAALYANFTNIENSQEKLKLSVPLISQANKIIDAEELFFNKTYPSGELTETIFGNILKANEYLAEISYWNLDLEELSLVESFFMWLGVNKFSKIETNIIANRWAESDYFDFIFNNGTDFPDDFDRGTFAKNIQFSKIKNFDQIKQLPISRLILLILKDEHIRQKLESNNERIDWFFTRWRPTINSEYSYIRYQFISSNIFTKYILEEGGEDLNKLINEDFQIDFDFLNQYGINKTEVKSILIKLGAKESFNDILPENIYEILKAIPEKDVNKNGRATQTIYKMALESLVKQESGFPIPDDIMYFSKKGETEEYQKSLNVYYADNTLLPKKILSTMNILNLPKRSGEDNVEKYFGVKSLREFKIQIVTVKLKFNPCDSEFHKLFEVIKPYILAYRLDSPSLKKRIADKDARRREARTLKNCRIHLTTQCYFFIGQNNEMTIEEKEFINDRDNFYFKLNTPSSTESLKKDSIFCDAFAEIMCIIFKVNDLKNDFRQILKNDLQDTIHLAIQDLGKEKIEEAFQLLGVSRIEITFWKNVFRLEGKKLDEPVEDIETLKNKILQDLQIELSEGYINVDFENFGNKDSFELIKQLCTELSLSVQSLVESGLYHWHKIQFANKINDLYYRFKQLIWHKLNDDSSKQTSFISILNEYNISFIHSLETAIESKKLELNIDYAEIVKHQINQNFKVDIGNTLSPDISIENLYNELLTQYSVEEADIAEEELRSLLYFDGNKEVIESFLKNHFASTVETDENDKDVTNVIGSLVTASLTKHSKAILLNGVNGSVSWIHSGLNDKGKKRKGKKAELLVYNTLKNEYGIENVKWVSGNSTTPDKNDKLHYDITYKNPDGVWKYLEVKAMSENQFIISGPEKEKGMSEPDDFELALVTENIIYMVKDIFKFNNNESFESNSNFVAYAKDYVFSFNVNPLNN